MLRGYSTDTRLQQRSKSSRGYVSPVPVGGRKSPSGGGNISAGMRKTAPEDTCVAPPEKRPSGGPVLPWGTDPRLREKKRPSDAGSGPRRPSKSEQVPDTPADIEFSRVRASMVPAGMRKIAAEDTCVAPREQRPSERARGPLLPWGTDPRPIARVASSPQLSRNGSQSARGTPTGMSRRSGSDGRLERPPETPSSVYSVTTPTAGNILDHAGRDAYFLSKESDPPKVQRDVPAMVSARTEPGNADIVYRKGRGVRNGYETSHRAAQTTIKDILDSEKAATIAIEQLSARKDPASTVIAGMTSTDLTRANRCAVKLGETVKVSRNKLTDPILHSIEVHGMLEDAEIGDRAGTTSIRQTELGADYPLNPGVFAPKSRTDPLGHKGGDKDLPPEKKTGLRTFANKMSSNVLITDRMPKRESLQERAAEKPRRESTQARAVENRPGTPGSMASLTSSRWR